MSGWEVGLTRLCTLRISRVITNLRFGDTLKAGMVLKILQSARPHISLQFLNHLNDTLGV